MKKNHICIYYVTFGTQIWSCNTMQKKPTSDGCWGKLPLYDLLLKPWKKVVSCSSVIATTNNAMFYVTRKILPRSQSLFSFCRRLKVILPGKTFHRSCFCFLSDSLWFTFISLNWLLTNHHKHCWSHYYISVAISMLTTLPNQIACADTLIAQR